MLVPFEKMLYFCEKDNRNKKDLIMLGVWVFIILLIFLAFCIMPGWYIIFVGVFLILAYSIDWRKLEKQHKRNARKYREKKRISKKE